MIDINDNRIGMKPMEYLTDLAERSTSDKIDELIMKALCMKIGFPNVVITSGIAYLDGVGTMENPPAPIQSIARTILKVGG